MSTLFKSYVRTLDRMGFVSSLFSFLLFSFVWSIGYACGVIMVVMGARLGYNEQIKGVIDDEMVARMNDEGPNN